MVKTASDSRPISASVIYQARGSRVTRYRRQMQMRPCVPNNKRTKTARSSTNRLMAVSAAGWRGSARYKIHPDPEKRCTMTTSLKS